MKPGRPTRGQPTFRDAAALHNGLGNSMKGALAEERKGHRNTETTGARTRATAEMLERQSVWQGDEKLALEILNKVRTRAPKKIAE
jgi:hypothetical protein